MQAPKNGFFYVLDASSGELISATPIATQTWTTGEIDKNGRPVVLPEAIELDDYVVLPGPTGAHNWHPMAYNDETGTHWATTKNGLPAGKRSAKEVLTAQRCVGR